MKIKSMLTARYFQESGICVCKSFLSIDYGTKVAPILLLGCLLVALIAI